MRSNAKLRRGVRFVVLTLLASTLSVTVGTGRAGADDPPTFITAWGSYGTGAGQMDHPDDVGVDPETGDVYVLDERNDRVQKFTATGTFLFSWGSGGTDPGYFDQPYGLAVDPSSGDVYVADTINHRIQKFDSSGTFLTTWGSFGTGPGQFNTPMGVAVDPDTGDVYVPDYGNRRVQKFTATGTFITAWGSDGTGDGEFWSPRGAAVDPYTGDVYVTDYSQRVQKFTSTGEFILKWGSPGTGPGEFGNTWHVAVDPWSRHVYVTDDGRARIQEFNPTGTFLAQWGSGGTGDGQFGGPVRGVAVDPRTGDVFAADTFSNRVQRFGDVTDPTAELVSPADGAVYTRGQAVVADFSCTDEPGGSGLGSCSGTVPDGALVPTSGYGNHAFTVTATDRATNVGEVTHTYTVATPRPDGRIKKGSGAFVGNDVYNTTGIDQTRNGSAPRGSTVTYTVKVQNDSEATDVLRLRGTTSTTHFRVSYTVGGTNVTSAVVTGTYLTPSLAPGASVSVTVTVKVKTSAPAGSSLSARLTAKSDTDPTKKDTVKFVTSRA